MTTEDAGSKALQKAGIDTAEKYLMMRGYEVVERSWECAAGEADIIAKDGKTLVFVEVKMRKAASQGFPSEAISAEKRDKFERIALAYLQSFNEVDISVRFDVVSIVVFDKTKALVRHHINALGPDC